MRPILHKLFHFLGLQPAFNPADYWEQRHQTHQDQLASVGHICQSEAENEVDYDIKIDHITSAISRALGTVKGKSILDAGCGIGILSEILVKQGANVCGVDFSQAAVSIARQRVPVGRFEDLPLELLSYEASFDGVVCMDVLFHVIDDDKWKLTFSRLAAAVKPDGSIIIQEMLDNITEESGPSHVRWRTLDHYRAFLAQLGLEISSLEKYLLPSEGVSKAILTIRHPR